MMMHVLHQQSCQYAILQTMSDKNLCANQQVTLTVQEQGG
jgi:hypothetical protein